MSKINQKITYESIKELFKEMFKQQETHLLKIISGNAKMYSDDISRISEEVKEMRVSLDIHLVNIGRDISQLKNECLVLQESIEMSDEVMRKNCDDLSNKINKQKNANQNNQNKIRELEDRERRNNIRIDGIWESDEEKWSDTEIKVKNFFKESLKIEQEIEIERAHRTGKKIDSRHRTIVLKLSKYKSKELILKNAHKLKGQNIYINEDFSNETRAIRKELIPKMWQHRKEGKFCVLSYDKLIIKSKTPRVGSSSYQK